MNQIVATFGIDWRELLIQAVNFAILIVLLWYFLYRPVLRIIDARREKVAESVRKAEAAQRELEDAQSEGKNIVADAAKRAEDLVGSARARANELSAETAKEAEAKARALIKEAQAQAAEAKRQAISESEREIVRAAMLAAEKVLLEKKA